MIDYSDPANHRLLAHTHPPDWENPRPADRYNLVVIGGGTAGLVTAAGAAGLGARVALVERHLLGGDCLNIGCVPSKTLLRAAKAVAAVREASRFGVRATFEGVDFPAVMQRVREVRADISPHDSAARFRSLGVDVFLGHGRFAGRDVVEVDGARLPFAKAVIATGGRATLPPVPGLAEAKPLTNETVFELTTQPARLAVIGGGPLGCELAQAFARLGTKVTLLEVLPRIMGKDEPEAAEIMTAALREDGISVRTGVKITRVTNGGGERRLELEGDAAPLVVDHILVAAGRAPNIEDLGLEAAGVEADKKGITVDDQLRSSNPDIYAAGDVCLDLKFTHSADASARLAIQNALFLGRKAVSALTIPWATYTEPEVARVGLSVEDAQARKVEVDVWTREFGAVDRAIADGETVGLVKILTAKGSDKIVGATIIGPHAGDLIGEVAVAMAGEVGLGKLARVIHPYPSYAESIRQVGDAYNRTRLTPLVKGLFDRWLRWRR